jgi:membrane protease YdiL (CAAX protease family)
MVFIWGLALFSLLGNIFSSNFQPGNVAAQDWFVSVGFLTLGFLLLPSTILSLRRILGHPSRHINIPAGRFALSIVLIPFAIFAGDWLLNHGAGGWAAPLHILVALLSVGWILWIAIHNLNPGSGQRSWGALGSGLALTPIFAFILEIIGAIFFILILAIYIGTNSELTRAVNSISTLTTQLNPNMELVLERLQPLFNDPFVLIMTIAGLGIFVPLIEELFKPIGVILLLGRKLTEAQGFALGAICGAGYALVENLTVGANAETWAFTSVGRFGTSAMHILTAALSGYALVRAKNEKRYAALFGTYVVNVMIHGIWNTLVVLTATTGLSSSNTAPPPALFYIGPALLVTLALTCIFFLRRYNHRLVQTQET